MAMTKRIDRIKQWTSEKLGQEQKTQESDEFKELEYEINMRYEGTERLHQSMSIYVRNLAKRRELDELDKASPIDILGQAMSIYGEEFVAESTYGQAMSRLGAANQKLAKTQEIFVDRIQRNFMEGIEKSIAQFKDFQVRLPSSAFFSFPPPYSLFSCPERAQKAGVQASRLRRCPFKGPKAQTRGLSS